MPWPGGAGLNFLVGLNARYHPSHRDLDYIIATLHSKPTFSLLGAIASSNTCADFLHCHC